MLASLEDRNAGRNRRFIAVDALHETAAAGRHVVHELRLVQLQAVEVDEVDVGAQARRQPNALCPPSLEALDTAWDLAWFARFRLLVEPQRTWSLCPPCDPRLSVSLAFNVGCLELTSAADIKLNKRRSLLRF